VNVLGLDLSLTFPGFAFGNRAVDMASIDYAKTNIDGDHRLNHTRDIIRHIVKSVQIDLAVIEGPAFSANGMFQMGMVHASARILLNDFRIPYTTVYPTALKLFATGHGTADKEQMIAAVTAAIGVVPADDNQADAWWLRAMGLAALGDWPVAMTDARRDTLAKVEWPPPVKPWGDLTPDKSGEPKLCGHKMVVMRNAGRWLHAFGDMTVCEKPKTTRRKTTAKGGEPDA
jgi:Holliday junction resolvasome RuvABC endonuclease subunit